MEATVLLCDYAEELSGKLYIMGGGWSRLSRQPANMSLAVKLSLPWEEAQAVHKVEAYLVRSTGEAVSIGDSPVRASGELQIPKEGGGARTEIPIDVAFILRFEGLILDPGVYAWRLEIDDQLLATVPFMALQPQASQGVPSGR